MMKKYHNRPDCVNTKTAWQITLEEAISQGLGACQKCFNRFRRIPQL